MDHIVMNRTFQSTIFLNEMKANIKHLCFSISVVYLQENIHDNLVLGSLIWEHKILNQSATVFTKELH